MDGINKIREEIHKELEALDNEKKKIFYEHQTNLMIQHMEEVADDEYNASLMQEHKSFRRMWEFVKRKAKELEVDGYAMVDDATVFGWIDEYVKLDDKAEVEAEIEAELKKAEKKSKGKAKSKTSKTPVKVVNETKTEESPDPFEDAAENLINKTNCEKKKEPVKEKQMCIFDLI